jgi:[acyl-carrier-protein] S-malonyltransferase
MNNGELLMCFPGQGSQSVGMLGSHIAVNSSIKACYEEASNVLGFDLWALVSEGPEEKLKLTEYAQPALLTAGVALWRSWRERGGPEPKWMTGHSLGECTALVCAESMSFSEGVNLVRERGRLMQNAVPVGLGAMYAILGLDTKVVEDICAKYHGEETVVQLVNYNSPGQMVIAGHKDATAQASKSCLESGARRAVPLAVSAPFHTDLMRSIAEEFSACLDALDLRAPRIPVIHNVHADVENDPGRIRELLVRQLYSPVRWMSCIEYAVRAGAQVTAECGPGKVICGLNKRIDKSLECYALDPADSFETTLSSVAG